MPAYFKRFCYRPDGKLSFLLLFLTCQAAVFGVISAMALLSWFVATFVASVQGELICVAGRCFHG